MSTQVPHTRVPITDAAGMLTQPWYKFLTQFQRDAVDLETSAGAGLKKAGGELSIAVGSVTNDMLADSAFATSIIGNPYPNSGAVQYIEATADNRILGRFGGQLMFKDASSITTANVLDGNYGDLTVAAGVWTINANVVTFAKFLAATSAGIVGATAAGNFAQLTAAQAKSVLALVAADVGLANVNNTSDANKPVSTAQQTALNLKANLAGGTAFTGGDVSVDAAFTLRVGALSASGAVTGSNLSGTNTGDQTITLTGNVTGSGSGSFATTIAAGVVTLAMQANMATASVVYRKTAGAGAPEVQTLATLKTDLGLTGTNSGDQTITLTSDVTGTGTGSFATTIAAGAVSLSKMANLNANSIIGNNTGSPATPAALTTAQVKALLAIANTDVSGLGTASTHPIGDFNQTANNLSDVASLNTAIRNLQGGYVLGQSAVQASHTGDLLESTLATITIPAGAMGANGQVVVEAQFSNNSSAGAKTPRIKFGGSQVTAGSSTTTTGTMIRARIANRNATNSQTGLNMGAVSYGNTSGAAFVGAVDTTASTTITITGQLGVNTDTISLESYQVILYPKA